VFLGRAVRPGAPAWLAADRAYALVWTANRQATCSGCGTRQDEWDEDEDAYISDHWTCPGCVRKHEHQQNNLDRDGDTVRPGQYVFLNPREQYERELAARRAAATTAAESD
jgi:hypothetical protein